MNWQKASRCCLWVAVRRVVLMGLYGWHFRSFLMMLWTVLRERCSSLAADRREMRPSFWSLRTFTLSMFLGVLELAVLPGGFLANGDFIHLKRVWTGGTSAAGNCWRSCSLTCTQRPWSFGSSEGAIKATIAFSLTSLGYIGYKSVIQVKWGEGEGQVTSHKSREASWEKRAETRAADAVWPKRVLREGPTILHFFLVTRYIAVVSSACIRAERTFAFEVCHPFVNYIVFSSDLRVDAIL